MPLESSGVALDAAPAQKSSGSTFADLPTVARVYVAVVIVSLLVGGQPPGADEGGQSVANWYLDNKNQVQVGGVISVVGGALLVFFFAYLRRILRPAEGEGGTLSLLALIGASIIARTLTN